MSTATRKTPANLATAQKRAAQKAEEVANLLHSFATALNKLDASTPNGATPAPRKATPRNWWKTQAGRFKNDPSFSDFVAQVQAARRQED